VIKTTEINFDTSKLPAFNELEDKVFGFFTHQSAALWDSFLCHQRENYLLGNMLEIGVYKGRSALLSSLHLGEQEKFFLIDGSPFIREAEKHLNPILGNRGCYIQKMSYDLEIDFFKDIRQKCRWIHIDGEHTGRAVINDLEFCEQMLSDNGILILDDFFNPMYPQLTEAAFMFLQNNKFKLSMFLCAWNKAYLARPIFAASYRNFIRQKLASELHKRDIHDFIITKTSTLDESTSFGICHRFVDRDYYGLDSDPDYLPV
jgi:hypothetical protein